MCAAGIDSINKERVVKSCERTVNMTTHLVKLQHKMVIREPEQGGCEEHSVLG